MTKPTLSAEFIELCKQVTGKRPRTVIEHILKHGFITTEDLKNTYGYDHPPRAARDVRECGIPLRTYWVKRSDGRKIGAYCFGDPKKVRFGRLLGRTALTTKLKQSLLRMYGSKCAIYLELFSERDLQIDHRIPFEVSGNVAEKDLDPKDFMLLCGSANRAKSWSCEHCTNWLRKKDPLICRSCYWAFPEDYSHIAMLPVRRLDMIWTGKEVNVYDRLKKKTKKLLQDLPAYVKEIIERSI